MAIDLKEDIRDVLNDRNKRQGEATDVLTALFRQLLTRLVVNYHEWNRLMENYLADPRNGVLNNSRQRSSERNNFNRASLFKTKMTWKQFMRCLRFLQVIKFRVTFELRFANMATHNVAIDVDMDGCYDDSDEPETVTDGWGTASVAPENNAWSSGAKYNSEYTYTNSTDTTVSYSIETADKEG